MAKGPQGGRGIDAVTVKLTRDAYEQTKLVLEHLAQFGWTSVGIERKDAPTIHGVLEEAVRLLAARTRTTRRKGRAP